MADTSGSLHSVREILLLKPEGHVDQADQNRDLQQRADDSGKGLARVNAEYGDSDSQLEIVLCSSTFFPMHNPNLYHRDGLSKSSCVPKHNYQCIIGLIPKLYACAKSINSISKQLIS